MNMNKELFLFAAASTVGLGVAGAEIIHRYDATAEGQLDETFVDSELGEDWTLVGAMLVDIESPFTDLNKGYILEFPEQGSGGDATPFPAGDSTYEIWILPGALDGDHQVLFETGGGQNGTSIMITGTTVRVLNSAGNTREFDIEVSLASVNLADMLQIVVSNDQSNGMITVYARGSAGGVASASAEGTVGRGGNRASLFTWGSGTANLGAPGDAGGALFNLGGRTEIVEDGVTPEGIRPFAGHISLVQVYDTALTEEEVAEAFNAHASLALPEPINSYDASAEDQTTEMFLDSAGGANWTLANTVLNTEISSPNTIFSAAYSLDPAGVGAGGTVGAFPAGDASYEVWVRPSELSADHEVVFETGGGQNGTSILINATAVRVLNSQGNARTFDISVPLDAINTSDFIQVVVSNDATNGAITVFVRGSAGGNASATAEGTVGRGGNAASLFTWGSGGANLGEPDAGFNNLGGRTELPDMTPEGAKPFAGEIALLNVYDAALIEEDVNTLFSVVAGADLPKILSFSASETVIGAGNSTTLSWETARSATITISPAVGDVTDQTTNGAGSVSVSPTTTTTYTLTVEGNGQTLTTDLLVIVGAPLIRSFSTEDSTISIGSETVLSWEVLGADSLDIFDGTVIGNVSGLTQTTVSPTIETEYTLMAINPFGTSMASVTVMVTELPIPSSGFDAAGPGNDEFSWVDPFAGNDWNLTEAELRTEIDSPSTSITAAYALLDDDPENLARGGATGGFPIGNTSAEVWVRVGDLDEGHQVIFENGGGSNGSSIMITDTTIRYIGSQGNQRNVDIELPTADLFLDDFIQIVFAIHDDDDLVDLYVRDTAGTVLHEQAEGAVTRGGNGAGLFVWASGGLGGSHNNLGGRTELDGESPEGLTNFRGEIALLNFYEETLTAEQVEGLFLNIATPGAGAATFAITSITRNSTSGEVTVTWRSRTGRTYTIEDSADLATFLELNDGVESEGEQTSATLSDPGTPLRYYRIREEN